MLKFDMVAKANALIIGKIDEPLEGRIEIAKIIFEAAVEVVNSGYMRSVWDKATDEIIAFGENHYGMVLPDKVLDSYIEEIRKDLKIARWDKRLLIKLRYKTFGTFLCTAVLEMDLNATIENMGYDKVTMPEDEDHITDVVEDNPSMETLNEINRLDVAQRRSRPKELLYPTSRFVRRVSPRNN